MGEGLQSLSVNPPRGAPTADLVADRTMIPTMTFHSINEAEKRLRDAGVWDAFQVEWKTARLETPKSERGALWKRLVAKYLPLDVAGPDDLLDLDDFPSQHCSMGECIRWVGANFARDDVVPAESPSPLAWGLMLWVRRGGESQFWSVIHPKLMPSRRAMEDDEDDGSFLRKNERLIQHVLDDLDNIREREFEDDPRMLAEVEHVINHRMYRWLP